MIDFPCRCGYKFSVPADLAGGAVQCPQCKLLVDVPGLGEIAQLEADGTIKVEGIPLKDEAAEERFRRAYEQRVDEDGELDLRPTMDEIIKSGAGEMPLDLADELLPGKPKYDPETGELIKPMEVRPPVENTEIPIAGLAPTLGYATDGERPMKLFGVPLRLLGGGNIAALLALTGVHLLLLIFMFIVGNGLYFVVPLPAFFLIFLLAHYTNVVEEVGLMERNEIPTPGRDMSWGEDILTPFTRLIMSVLIAWPALLVFFASATNKIGMIAIFFWPALLLQTMHSSFSGVALLEWCMFFAGVIIFPAVLMTLSTSGAVHNLRPDRLWGTMKACGRMYLLAMILCAIAMPTYMLGLGATTTHVMSLGWITGNNPAIREAADAIPPLIAYPLLVFGIYVMHAFCWFLGLYYRANHARFPWILQWHTPTKKIERRIPPPRPKRRPAVQVEGAAAQTPVGDQQGQEHLPMPPDGTPAGSAPVAQAAHAQEYALAPPAESAAQPQPAFPPPPPIPDDDSPLPLEPLPAAPGPGQGKP